MDDQPEVIRQQMEETRGALQEKLGALEQQVIHTVQDASQAVESVKETVTAVKESVQETVVAVKDSVQGTVDSVKDTMHDTVESVKDTLNLERQVQAHPWAMVAGATAVGFLGYKLFNHLTTRARTGPQMAAGAMVYPGPPISPPMPVPTPAYRDRPNGFTAPPSAPPAKPNWLSTIAEHYSAEIDKAKALAISALGSVARDLVVQSVPPAFEERAKEIVDNVTTKLGGEPMEQSILDFGGRGREPERQAS